MFTTIRVIAFIVIALSAYSEAGEAADAGLSWETDPVATHTTIERRLCQEKVIAGETLLACGPWEVAIADIIHPTYCVVGCSLSIAHNVPSNMLVHFRFVQKNANGATVRMHSGVWHNDAWLVPGPARNVGTR